MALLSRNRTAGPATSRRGGGKGTAPKPKGTAPKPKQPRGARLKQVRAAWTMTRESDPRLLPLTLGAFLAPLALGILLGLLVGPVLLWVPLGFAVGVLAATFVFGRRVQGAAFSGVEGQPGAAAAVLKAMRGDWRVQPAVAFNREQELVHLVLGRPGVVLVAEPGPTGAHRGTRNLIGTEKKRLARVLGDTPVYDVLVGDEEGQVPLRGLEKHFLKLPRNIKPAEVNQLEPKLKALSTNRLPIPKGPMPKSARIPRGKVR
jgi:hypothetical protein